MIVIDTQSVANDRGLMNTQDVGLGCYRLTYVAVTVQTGSLHCFMSDQVAVMGIVFLRGQVMAATVQQFSHMY